MKTTLNVHVDILEKISEAARMLKMSRTEIIVLLLKKAMDEIRQCENIGKGVRYQKRRNPDEWHRFHLKLKDEEYEYLLDLRKVKKMSASLILAVAVKKYLKEIMKWKGGDNYRYRRYSVSLKIFKRVKILRIIWYLPPEDRAA